MPSVASMANPLDMTDTDKQRPSVPSSSEAPNQGSGTDSNRAEGAKNHWVRTGCHWKLKICTYNARTLSTDKILELEDELTRIKFDVIGLCETRMKGEGCITLSNSGHNLYYKGGNTCHNGVGFVVHKDVAGNVTSFKGISDRVAQLTIKINGRYHLNIIQTYLPTSSHTDEEVDTVYEKIDTLISNSKAHYNIIMGDFNAKVGIDGPTSSCIGSFGLGTRNSRGDSLINFANRHQMKIMNTFFKKAPTRRWTWISPNGATKNEIDFIISDKPHIFTDVSVVNSLNTGSDHRLVRASLTINTKLERAKLMKRRKKPNTTSLTAKATEFQLKLTNRFEALEVETSSDLDTHCDNITTTILETAVETAGRDKPPKPDKLSVETKQLREKRRQMKRDGLGVQHVEYTAICKTIRHRMKEEIQSYNEEQQLKALENNRGLKSTKKKQCLGRNNIIALKEEDDSPIEDLDRIVKRCEEFYTNLYSTRQPQEQPFSDAHNNKASPPPPAILSSEVRDAIKKMKRDKAPGEDNITANILKDGGEPIVETLTKFFNRCLTEGRVPSSWRNASVVILHKKGDTADIKNYRPISLLPVMYKVFSHILLRRILHTLDQHQPREQAGFRAGFSTIDHIHVVSQIQEKANEYKIPLCLAYVDYEKAFDSIEFTPLFRALENQGVDPAYTNIIKDLYNGATSTLKLHRDSDKIKLERGARQGDNISPKLFTACLQDAIISKINWDNKGINIDGEHLSHLIFADDIILFAKSPIELESMLTDIHRASKPVGLNMHLGKTKVMFNDHTNQTTVTVDGKNIEQVSSYVYLGKTVTNDGDLLPEIKRRIGLGWAAFGKVENIMKSRKASMEIKSKIFNEYILPVMAYGCETWALNKTMMDKLAVAQRKMERIMLGITLQDQRRNDWIRDQTKVLDIINFIKKAKHRWAGHVARFSDNRWTIRVTEWTPREWTRKPGRPKTRWRDDLSRHLGPTWSRTAKDRCHWKYSGEGLLNSE